VERCPDRVYLRQNANVPDVATSESGGRPQDQGRRHRKRGPDGAASPETASRLAAWRTALRAELDLVIVELAGKPAPAGLIPDATPAMVRPSLADRTALVTLGDRIARALGEDVDPPPPAEPPTVTRRRRGRPDFG
jgi:hypothetical protein